MDINKKKMITVSGAREHNLKNITVQIPKDSLTVITGPSGSGKSSLAMDILYAEGQRRYMESLSSYARQFLGMPKKPDVDRIEGLCPAIAIDQKTVGSNPRSTVGTITEIYDYLRVLFARIGIAHCPQCHQAIQPVSPDKVTTLIQEKFINQNIIIAAPIAQDKKGEFVTELEQLYQDGITKFIIDGQRYSFKSPDDIKNLRLKKTYKHTIDALIDAVEVIDEEKVRIQEALEKAFKLASGLCKIIVGEQSFCYSTHRICITCDQSFPDLEPRLFSFNSPIGACTECQGLGVVPNYSGLWQQEERFELNIPCRECEGKRLNPLVLSVTINNKNIHDIGNMSLKQALDFFTNLQLKPTEKVISERLLLEINNRLSFLLNVGLSYLTLNRTARTLSGGEGQRIRLATQIGSSLSGVLYILDEPSIGLHQRDNDRLIATLQQLRDLGNTVVVVEHDHDTMLSADHIIDMGPAAGVHGGHIVATGTPKELQRNKQSLTGAYLAGKQAIRRMRALRTPKGYITLNDATANNLKNISTQFPLGVLCGVSGVSGSGKSSLIMQELVPSLHSTVSSKHSFHVSKIEGVNQIDNVVVIDQTPIGRTPRSNPATYLGIFDDIRKLFASLPESNLRGYTAGRFSFNTGEGRCKECSGEGILTISMHLLPDVTMTCSHCKGLRYNRQTLDITFKNKNIAQILDMTALEAAEFFATHATLAKRLRLLCDVGLDYIKLGQSSITLSGGEAQRIKLVDELAKRGHNTFYILDEPTTGLHTHDIAKLLQVFEKLVDKGNTVLVIEHNLDVLKMCDHVIDLGPEGGDQGGFIVAQGSPFTIAQEAQSHTGRYLKKILEI